MVGRTAHVRDGKNIGQRNTPWSAGGNGGTDDVGAAGSGYRASYQLLRDRASGAEVLAVSTHMFSGTNAASCAERARETTNHMSPAAARAARARSGGVPTVYAGDFGTAPGTGTPGGSPGRTTCTPAAAPAASWAAGSWFTG